MNRRQLLIGTAGLFSLVTGCIQGGGGSGGSPSSPESTETTNTRETPPATTAPPATAEQAFFDFDTSHEKPQATASVGDRTKLPDGDVPEVVAVWNDTTTVRPIHVRIAGTDGDPVFEQEYQLEPDAYVSITLLTPDTYTVALRVDGKRRRPVRVPRSLFDCNGSRTTVRIVPDGSIEFVTISTMKGCGTSTGATSTPQ